MKIFFVILNNIYYTFSAILSGLKNYWQIIKIVWKIYIKNPEWIKKYFYIEKKLMRESVTLRRPKKYLNGGRKEIVWKCADNKTKRNRWKERKKKSLTTVNAITSWKLPKAHLLWCHRNTKNLTLIKSYTIHQLLSSRKNNIWLRNKMNLHS